MVAKRYSRVKWGQDLFSEYSPEHHWQALCPPEETENKQLNSGWCDWEREAGMTLDRRVREGTFSKVTSGLGKGQWQEEGRVFWAKRKLNAKTLSWWMRRSGSLPWSLQCRPDNRQWILRQITVGPSLVTKKKEESVEKDRSLSDSSSVPLAPTLGDTVVSTQS